MSIRLLSKTTASLESVDVTISLAVLGLEPSLFLSCSKSTYLESVSLCGEISNSG